MLNFKVNVDIDINSIKYPILFNKRNICIHCGAEGSLKFVDKFGRETRQEIHPFDHIKCCSCGRKYSILWKRDETNGKMYPVATDREIKQEFLNFIYNQDIKKNGTMNINP